MLRGGAIHCQEIASLCIRELNFRGPRPIRKNRESYAPRKFGGGGGGGLIGRHAD